MLPMILVWEMNAYAARPTNNEVINFKFIDFEFIRKVGSIYIDCTDVCLHKLLIFLYNNIKHNIHTNGMYSHAIQYSTKDMYMLDEKNNNSNEHYHRYSTEPQHSFYVGRPRMPYASPIKNFQDIFCQFITSQRSIILLYCPPNGWIGNTKCVCLLRQLILQLSPPLTTLQLNTIAAHSTFWLLLMLRGRTNWQTTIFNHIIIIYFVRTDGRTAKEWKWSIVLSLGSHKP